MQKDIGGVKEFVVLSEKTIEHRVSEKARHSKIQRRRFKQIPEIGFQAFRQAQVFIIIGDEAVVQAARVGCNTKCSNRQNLCWIGLRKAGQAVLHKKSPTTCGSPL